MNSVQLIATITKEIETKYTQAGTAIASFSVAYNERVKAQDGTYQDKAHFFDVTAWGKNGETISKHFSRGDKIGISGTLEQQSWTTKEGQKRSRVGIVLKEFDFIGNKSQPKESAPQQEYTPTPSQPEPQSQQVPDFDPSSEDIPF